MCRSDQQLAIHLPLGIGAGMGRGDSAIEQALLARLIRVGLQFSG